MSASLRLVSSNPGVSIKVTVRPLCFIRYTEVSWVPGYISYGPEDWLRKELDLQEHEPSPIFRSFRPVALEMNVDFPAPVTPMTAIKCSSEGEPLVFHAPNADVGGSPKAMFDRFLAKYWEFLEG